MKCGHCYDKHGVVDFVSDDVVCSKCGQCYRITECSVGDERLVGSDTNHYNNEFGVNERVTCMTTTMKNATNRKQTPYFSSSYNDVMRVTKILDCLYGVEKWAVNETTEEYFVLSTILNNVVRDKRRVNNVVHGASVIYALCRRYNLSCFYGHEFKLSKHFFNDDVEFNNINVNVNATTPISLDMLTSDVYDKVVCKYIEIINAFRNEFGGMYERMSVKYCVYKACSLLGYDNICKRINVFSVDINVRRADMMYKRVCERKGWKFMPMFRQYTLSSCILNVVK